MVVTSIVFLAVTLRALVSDAAFQFAALAVLIPATTAVYVWCLLRRANRHAAHTSRLRIVQQVVDADIPSLHGKSREPANGRRLELVLPLVGVENDERETVA